MKVETIAIVDDNRRGFKNINKSDFDADVHKLYGVDVVEDDSVNPTKTPKELLIDEASSLGIDTTGLTNRQLKKEIKEAKV